MDIFDDPMQYENGRTKMFLEARDLVNEQFPDATTEAKMSLIGSMVMAHSILLAGQKIGDELCGASVTIQNSGEN